MVPEPYTCDLDIITNTKLKVYIFKNVQNVEAIRNNVVSGAWSCAVVKASLVADPLQLATAANRAVVLQHQGNMITRTVYAEILYNLSLTKNISQSLTKFGVEKERDIIVCFLEKDGKCSSADILPQIEGEQCSLDELSSLTDWKQVKSAYKLNNLKGDVDLVDVIVSRMVTKNFVSH